MELAEQYDDDDDNERDSGTEGDSEPPIVFFQPLRDDSVSRFERHEGRKGVGGFLLLSLWVCCVGSVFVVSLDPACSMVVTGGQDERGFVWKIDDMSLLFECGGKR